MHGSMSLLYRPLRRPFHAWLTVVVIRPVDARLGFVCEMPCHP
jgi:hypothetical protein